MLVCNRKPVLAPENVHFVATKFCSYTSRFMAATASDARRPVTEDWFRGLAGLAVVIDMGRVGSQRSDREGKDAGHHAGRGLICLTAAVINTH